MPLHKFKISKRPNLGRPQDDKRAEAFLEVARHLEENDDEQITINDLIDLVNQKLADTKFEAYGYSHMKLQEHFGERIIRTEINGKPNMVTFRTTARVVLQDYYSKQQQNKKTLQKRKSSLYRQLQTLSRKISKPLKHPMKSTQFAMTRGWHQISTRHSQGNTARRIICWEESWSESGFNWTSNDASN